jgi:superfamily II DNA or RNA helicase
MPPGSGKTHVLLLAAKVLIVKQERKVIYVCMNKGLLDQVVEKAKV